MNHYKFDNLSILTKSLFIKFIILLVIKLISWNHKYLISYLKYIFLYEKCMQIFHK